ncbi:hypothetical protein FDB61_17835 [Clostridium botulinum]|nr:hypothetical protein [Clostridium botulinum]
MLLKIPITRKEISDVRLRLYKINLWDEKLLRYKAVAKYIQSILVFVILSLLSIVFFNKNLYVMFILIFFSYQIKNLILDWTIGDDTHLLKGLLDYLDDFMQEFSFSKNVRLSLKEAKEQSTNYTTVVYIEKIIEAIDDEEKMEEYSVECHNEFLKLLGITCFLTNEYGDTFDNDGISNFIKNIENIKTLINLELYKRRELKYWIKGLPFQCILPLLLFVPYESWVNSVFTMVKRFYETSSAFIFKIGITVICLICFSIIKSYERTESEPIVHKKARWEQKLFKIKPIAKFIKFIMPKEDSKRQYKYKDLISKSGLFTKIEYIYLRKFLFGLGAFILSLLITISINKINYNNILKNNTTTFKNDLITASGKQIESIEIENEILNSLNSTDPKENKEIATQMLMQKGVLDQTTLNNISTKIVKKKEALANQNEKWWEIILSLAIGISATTLPEFFIRVRINARKLSMEAELILFETIILILIAHDNCTTELILEYMSKFSIIFKDYIDIIIKKFDKLDYEAIEDILDEVNYKQFTSIIRNIMKAEDIGIKEAFVSLSSNRANSLKDRKGEYEKLINSRVAKSKLVSKIPVGLFMIGYVIVPILGISFVQLIDIKNQLDVI